MLDASGSGLIKRWQDDEIPGRPSTKASKSRTKTHDMLPGSVSGSKQDVHENKTGLAEITGSQASLDKDFGKEVQWTDIVAYAKSDASPTDSNVTQLPSIISPKLQLCATKHGIAILSLDLKRQEEMVCLGKKMARQDEDFERRRARKASNTAGSAKKATGKRSCDIHIARIRKSGIPPLSDPLYDSRLMDYITTDQTSQHWSHRRLPAYIYRKGTLPKRSVGLQLTTRKQFGDATSFGKTSLVKLPRHLLSGSKRSLSCPVSSANEDSENTDTGKQPKTHKIPHFGLPTTSSIFRRSKPYSHILLERKALEVRTSASLNVLRSPSRQTAGSEYSPDRTRDKRASPKTSRRARGKNKKKPHNVVKTASHLSLASTDADTENEQTDSEVPTSTGETSADEDTSDNEETSDNREKLQANIRQGLNKRHKETSTKIPTLLGNRALRGLKVKTRHSIHDMAPSSKLHVPVKTRGQKIRSNKEAVSDSEGVKADDIQMKTTGSPKRRLKIRPNREAVSDTEGVKADDNQMKTACSPRRRQKIRPNKAAVSDTENVKRRQKIRLNRQIVSDSAGYKSDDIQTKTAGSPRRSQKIRSNKEAVSDTEGVKSDDNQIKTAGSPRRRQKIRPNRELVLDSAEYKSDDSQMKTAGSPKRRQKIKLNRELVSDSVGYKSDNSQVKTADSPKRRSKIRPDRELVSDSDGYKSDNSQMKTVCPKTRPKIRSNREVVLDSAGYKSDDSQMKTAASPKGRQKTKPDRELVSDSAGATSDDSQLTTPDLPKKSKKTKTKKCIKPQRLIPNSITSIETKSSGHSHATRTDRKHRKDRSPRHQRSSPRTLEPSRESVSLEHMIRSRSPRGPRPIERQSAMALSTASDVSSSPKSTSPKSYPSSKVPTKSKRDKSHSEQTEKAHHTKITIPTDVGKCSPDETTKDLVEVRASKSDSNAPISPILNQSGTGETTMSQDKSEGNDETSSVHSLSILPASDEATPTMARRELASRRQDFEHGTPQNSPQASSSGRQTRRTEAPAVVNNRSSTEVKKKKSPDRKRLSSKGKQSKRSASNVKTNKPKDAGTKAQVSKRPTSPPRASVGGPSNEPDVATNNNSVDTRAGLDVATGNDLDSLVPDTLTASPCGSALSCTISPTKAVSMSSIESQVFPSPISSFILSTESISRRRSENHSPTPPSSPDDDV